MAEADHKSDQAAKFRHAASELECDEDEARFEETVKRLARAPRQDPEPKAD